MRTALGANPTMTLRQHQQLIEDQKEVVEASPHTHTGATDFMSGDMVRVRDRQAAAEASKPEALRPRDPVAVMYEEMHERWAREAAESERKKIAARQRRDAVTALQQRLIADCGLSPDAAERIARERIGG